MLKKLFKTLTDRTTAALVGALFVLTVLCATGATQLVPVTQGGTGVGSPTAHGVMVAEGSSPMVPVGPSSTSGLPLLSQGNSSDPAFSALGVNGGGTGATTLAGNGALVMNSGGTAMATVAPGANGNVLTSNGTSWVSQAPSGIEPGTDDFRLNITGSTGISAFADPYNWNSTIFLCPAVGNRISLYYNSTWTSYTDSSYVSLYVGGLGTGFYGIYAYPTSSTTFALTYVSSPTSYAAVQDGVQVYSSNHSYRLVGYIETLSGLVYDTYAIRNLCNTNNKTVRHLYGYATGTYTTSSTSWTQVGTVQVNYVTDGTQAIPLTGLVTAESNSNGSSSMMVGIGTGSTSTADSWNVASQVAADFLGGSFGGQVLYIPMTATSDPTPSAGYQTDYLLFRGSTTGTYYAYGELYSSPATEPGIVLRGTIMQ